MPMNLSSIFQGVTTREFRGFMYHALMSARKAGYQKFVDPCVGTFAMAGVALQAGFKPEDIVVSDVTVFSAMLGYYIMGRPYEELGITVLHDIADDIAKKCGKFDYAETLLSFKCLQLREHIEYEKMYSDELLARPAFYAAQIAKTLDALKAKFQGVKYENKDLAVTFDEQRDDPKTVIYINPPGYAGGYEKMFDLREAVEWDAPTYKTFEWKKDFPRLFTNALASKALCYVYRLNGQTKEEAPYNTFSVEKEIGGRYDSILCNRPDEVPEAIRRAVPLPNREKLKPVKAHIFDGEITPDSKVSFVFTKREHGLYYRNLWLHRLGETQAEAYMLWFIDGKIFSTCGLHLADLRRGKSNYLFESFGFGVPHPKYPNLTRLLMLCLTSGEFERKVIASKCLRKLPLNQVVGIKTTCLSRYRKVKLNNGILDVQFREKLPDSDMYRIMYVAPFRKDTFKDCVARYLGEMNVKANAAEEIENGAS